MDWSREGVLDNNSGDDGKDELAWVKWEEC